ncbi:MAG: hypothetical protein IPG02_15605 [Ignavibacteria bacterium]|nr:hypothetical protein [Ignavibacteria bacterium]
MRKLRNILKSLAISKEIGDKKGIVAAMNSLGSIAYYQEIMSRIRNILKKAWSSVKKLVTKRNCDFHEQPGKYSILSGRL